jgi:putative peptide zinc metalloprotease protein
MINQSKQQHASDQGLLAATIQLRPDLQIHPNKDGTVVIEDPLRGKFFSVGHREHRFIALLDGKLSLGQVQEMLDRPHQNEHYSTEVVQSISSWLNQNQLILGSSDQQSARLVETSRRQKGQRLIGRMNPVSFKVGLGNPTRFLRRIEPATSWLFSKWMLLVWSALLIFAVLQVNNDWERFTEASVGILSQMRWVWLLLVWVVLKLIHEMAHGVACLKFGGEVRESGILFLLFTPMPYVDVSSSWRFGSTRKRITVAAAGMYVELLLAAIAAIIWSRVQTGIVADICYNIIIMASLTTILFNANPLMRFDGYYIATDAMGIVNLYQKSQQWFMGLLKNAFFGFGRSRLQEPSWRGWIVRGYAFAATLWKITLTAGLVIAASCLFGGAGWILGLFGFGFWVALPVYQFTKQIVAQHRVTPIRWSRLATAVSMLCVLVSATIFVLTAPRLNVSPAIVHLKNEQVIRASADGFVSQILVADGDRVQIGDALLRLKNPQLRLQANQLLVAIEQSRIQSRVWEQKGELDRWQGEQQLLAGLVQQYEEVVQQMSTLTIRAPQAGIVHRRNLQNLQGSFVRRGDSILQVSDPSSLEFLVSISQDQVDSLEEIRNNDVLVMLPGKGVLTAAVYKLTPRASDAPLAPEWCVPNGGPLPVVPVVHTEADSGTEYRLLEPRFTAHVSVAPSREYRLHAGQRAKAFLQTRQQSLATYLYQSVKGWVEHKLEIATKS